MAKDLFSSLGGGLGEGLSGLAKGLSSFMPQDDPAVKALNASSNIKELKKKELDIYCEIGKKAFASGGAAAYPDESLRLAAIQTELKAAETAMSAAEAEAQAAETAANTIYCQSCNSPNTKGAKFCQQCGAKLTEPDAKLYCTACGTENPMGTKFCSECGAKLEG